MGTDAQARGLGTKIHSAVIQGNLAESHRNMNITIHELLRYIEEDPSSWGYRFDLDQDAYLPLSSSDDNVPFKLHLTGHNPPPIPAVLRHVVDFHYSPDYPTMFRIVHQADVVLPAFHPHSDYTKRRASSTNGIAVSARVSNAKARLLVRFTHHERLCRRHYSFQELPLMHTDICVQR